MKKKNLVSISVRMPESTIAGLKKIAAAKGIGYLTYLRMLATVHVQMEKEK
jgi:predicted DNA binding CopG/RHH family protein